MPLCWFWKSLAIRIKSASGGKTTGYEYIDQLEFDKTMPGALERVAPDKNGPLPSARFTRFHSGTTTNGGAKISNRSARTAYASKLAGALAGAK